MAALTMTDILARARVVLEAAPCALTRSNDAFSHDRQPNAVLDRSYYLEDGGLVSSRSVGNYDAVRIDRLTVYVAMLLSFDSTQAFADVETKLTEIERAMVADGPAQGYAIGMAPQRRVTRAPGADVVIGSVSLTVDYDFDEV